MFLNNSEKIQFCKFTVLEIIIMLKKDFFPTFIIQRQATAPKV